MKIIDLNNINFPTKSSEEFNKIDFSTLFNQEFKSIEKYQLDIMGLEEIEDKTKYDNFLYDLTYNSDKKQIVLTINSNIPEPICLIHKLIDNDIFYTNSIKIQIKEDIKASIIEVFTSNCKGSLYSVNRTFELEENSKLEYLKLQDINESNYFLYNTYYKQDKNSYINFINLDFGNGFIVNNHYNHIKAQNVQFNVNALVKLQKSSTTANMFKTSHKVESSLSNINFKHILTDHSKAIFKALSRVEKNALYSKAFQNSNTLLLSDDASIFAQPHLEILTDELEASHGATTGSLDEEQLLYLQTRGIPLKKAETMLLVAFERDIYKTIKDELILEFLQTYKRDRYV